MDSTRRPMIANHPVKLTIEVACPYIEAMTNWQRNQWARAGYPMDRESLGEFATRPHWKLKI